MAAWTKTLKNAHMQHMPRLEIDAMERLTWNQQTRSKRNGKKKPKGLKLTHMETYIAIVLHATVAPLQT